MNNAQLQKYHINRRQWEAARIARGLPYNEAALDKLKLETIGRVCSSKDFKQHELDAMLAAFLAVTQPANFDAQMQQQNQADLRRSMSVRRIDHFARCINLTPGRESGYVSGISAKLFGETQYQKLPEPQLAQLEGILVRRVIQIHGRERAEAIQNEAAEVAHRFNCVLTGQPTDEIPF